MNSGIYPVCSTKKHRSFWYLWCLVIYSGCFLFLPFVGAAQIVEPSPPTTDPTTDTLPPKEIVIHSTDVLREVDGMRQLVGNVQVSHDSVYMFCDSAIIIGQDIQAFGDVVIQQEDSVNIFADTLYYNGTNRQAELAGNVVLSDSVQNLFTERLYYDLNTDVGRYNTGATLQTETTELTSRTGYYYVNTREAFFKDDVIVVDTNYTLQSDTLKINTQTSVTYFLGPTDIVSNDNEIYCESGFYDTRQNYAEFEKNARFVQEDQISIADKIRYDGNLDQVYLEGDVSVEKAEEKSSADYIFYDVANNTTQFRNNVVIVQPPRIIRADSLDYNDKTKSGLARGNVTLIDSEQELTIDCAIAEYRDSLNYIRAYGRPLLTTLLQQDSLYLSADTLISFTENDSLETRRLIGHYDVRIYKSDLQGICDSLTYSTKDSTFRFFYEPLLWSDTTQFDADTILMELKNEAIHQIHLQNKAFIINTRDSVYYNQIKGKDIIAHFDSSELRRIDVPGNGESIYYLTDDNNAYVGVNETVCSAMLIYFGNNQVESIHFYTNPTATIYPMFQISHKKLRLDGFKWEAKRRPNSPNDLR